MRIRTLVAASCLLLNIPVLATESDEWLENAKQRLKATFPSFTAEDVRRSEIPGLAEVYGGPNLVYFAPEQNVLFIGEMYSANGVSITKDKLSAFTAQKAASADIDLTKAVTVGQGPTEVIAFVDPDCGYCKRAHQWFEKHKFEHVRQHVFFVPLTDPRRRAAHARALQAVCAPAELKEEAIRQLYQPRSSTDQSALLTCDFGEAQLAAHAEIARRVGAFATPFFLVKTPSASKYEVIAGFDEERLASLLTSTSKE